MQERQKEKSQAELQSTELYDRLCLGRLNLKILTLGLFSLNTVAFSLSINLTRSAPASKIVINLMSLTKFLLIKG